MKLRIYTFKWHNTHIWLTGGPPRICPFISKAQLCGKGQRHKTNNRRTVGKIERESAHLHMVFIYHERGVGDNQPESKERTLSPRHTCILLEPPAISSQASLYCFVQGVIKCIFIIILKPCPLPPSFRPSTCSMLLHRGKIKIIIIISFNYCTPNRSCSASIGSCTGWRQSSTWWPTSQLMRT